MGTPGKQPDHKVLRHAISLLCSEKVLAGSRWATDRGMTRNLTAEARVAVKAL